MPNSNLHAGKTGIPIFKRLVPPHLVPHSALKRVLAMSAVANTTLRDTKKIASCPRRRRRCCQAVELGGSILALPRGTRKLQNPARTGSSRPGSLSGWLAPDLQRGVTASSCEEPTTAVVPMVSSGGGRFPGAKTATSLLGADGSRGAPCDPFRLLLPSPTAVSEGCDINAGSPHCTHTPGRCRNRWSPRGRDG
jgi:hypothetical protein